MYISNDVAVEVGENKLHIAINNNYPSEGNIDIEIQNNDIKSSEITVAFRVPLYVKDFQIIRNGEKISNFEIENGYAKICGIFKKESIKIIYKENAKFVRANPLVRADAGKVAIIKGPFVYCLEEVDNGTNLELLGGIKVVNCKGRKISTKNWGNNELYKEREVETEEVNLKAVPYCSWGNRKTGEMIVWLKETI
jgi:DUF1680 family protein